LIAGCGDTTAPTFTAAPTIAANPNRAVPLAAIVSADTNEPAVLLIQISDGNREWNIPTSHELATRHSLAVLGFRPDRRHVLQISARDEAGNISAAMPLEFETAPLPDGFPSLEVSVSSPEKMEAGVTLFSLMRWPEEGDTDDEFGLAIAVDEQGEVVWYRRSDHLFEDPHRMTNGNLLSLLGNNRAEEVDMLGNVVTRWHAAKHPNEEANADIQEGSIPVATETFHHDIQEMPSGNLLVLSTEMRRIEDYPTVVDDDRAPKAAANVIGDVVVEFARDGSIVNEWKLMDLLDVRRLGYESLGEVWNQWAYVDVDGGTRDWAHGNSVSYQADTDSILVSLRHQEAVINFSRQSGELNWILGTHEGWGERWAPYLLKPEGEFAWPFHQHAAEMTASGSLILFDNGNFRSVPPQPKITLDESYSRAVEYAIDTESMTVRQAWSYGGPGEDVFYSPFMSEADELPQTGNVLIADGGRIRDQQGRPSDRIVGGHHWARIVEVTHSDPPEKVFEITIDSSKQDASIGWAVYRSERLPSLYGH
jgi:hypothetical protein